MEVILFLGGVVLGSIISAAINKMRSIGALRIDQSDPADKPYMFLEIKRGVEDISRRKLVVLKVKRENFIPHK